MNTNSYSNPLSLWPKLSRLHPLPGRAYCLALWLLVALWAGGLLSASGATIAPGARISSVLVTNATDAYTFAVSAGDNVVLRAGGASFTPKLELYGSDGTLLAASSSSSLNNRDAEIFARVTNSGFCTVSLSSYYAKGFGNYALSLAQAPASVTIAEGDEGGPLTNGWRHTARIEVGDLDQWNFQAAAGDNIVLRMGTTNFTPWIRLYGPDGTLLDASESSSLNNRDGEAAFRATNSGTFTVVASSYYLNGSGDYSLSLALTPGAIFVASGDEGGPLTNGWRHTGNIGLGDLDVYSFSASAGDNIVLRMGTTNFTPSIRLYGPDGVLLDASQSSSLNNRDGEATFHATNSGSFTVVASSYYLNGSGDYSLSLALTPGAIFVAPSDEGGPLTNGWRHTGNIGLGDLDVYSFSANAGDNIILRMGTTNFTPSIRLYGPDRTLLDASESSSLNNRDGEATFRATNSGSFTVVASSYYLNGSGDYSLSLALTPGAIFVAPSDEGGPLTNGWQHTGNLGLGDLDVYSFSANAGDNIILRMGTTNFTPWIRLYGSDGTLLDASQSSSLNNRDGEAAFRATNSGSFTVVASSYYLNGSGDYSLSLAVSPGAIFVAPSDEGGPLTNGWRHAGYLALGELDVWSFSANAGDSIILRMGSPSFTPALRLYGPDGALTAASSSSSLNNRDGEIEYQATNSGTFTVVASSYYLNGFGDYNLSLAVPNTLGIIAPGDEGGGMTGASAYQGVLQTGDADVWTFNACEGETISLAMTGTNFTPSIQLFGPTGARLAATTSSSLNTRTVALNYQATNCGTFMIVASSYYLNGTGGYEFTANQLTDAIRLCLPGNTLQGWKISGSRGTAGVAEFVLYTATNAAAPAPNWIPLWTNQFDAFGAFYYTNSSPLSAAGQYYRLEAR